MSHRLHHIDAFKVVASNLIVLHHFTAYGPLADALDRAAPHSTDWLFDYGRMAVQVFLVIGGYFAASAIAPHGAMQIRRPWRLVINRYIRLVPPLVAALVFVGGCSLLVGPSLGAGFIPGPPTLMQVMAHVLLLNGVLGYPSLSLGIWYVAIDFQLYAATVVLLSIGRRSGRWLVAGTMVASLFYFNLHESGDNWPLYFFGSYGMGAVAWWAGHSRHAGKWLLALAMVGLAALAWDFRLRIALALITALLLGYARWRLKTAHPTKEISPRFARWLRVSGRSAYALFLTHFATWILANGLWIYLGATSVSAAILAACCAWMACQGLARLFERYIERPLARVRLSL